ncbi:putative N2,N2-dimethylguanosine tRNA methyltransferase [Handroanthus impetiginosus]|uniref:Putative N2,N2-dimethylguanosine tRNA methyltransferase n=1 Tax=Handroanthus impetiginosus TaxID=429701 RepID=A0A2G9GP95_9LAMI|nr:putative N2,N2-dimethylguanosine tRNA methyltransferase [Handroanthus impetiginosus]
MIQSTPLEDHTEDPAQIQQQQQNYLLHSINSTIVIRQLPSQGISFQLWPAATTLITLLDRRHPSNTAGPLSPLFNNWESRGLRILELGSGTGVVGIAAAALLGASVTVTDLPHVLLNLQFNVDANAGIVKLHGGAVDVAALSWGNIKEMEAIGREHDIILGSDLVYHDHLYEPLLETLRYFLLGSEKKVVFLMGHLKRWKKESVFFKKANKFSDVKIVHTDSPSNGSRVGVTVYQFVRNGGLMLKPEIR